MRRLLLAPALALALAPPAAAGPVSVEIQAGAPVSEPFLVSVTGHYADLHNGHSRHWKDALVAAGARRFVPLGPVNPLLNLGVSVSVYHPEYVVETARSEKTPLLLRPVRFATFTPRAWRDVMAAGETELGELPGSPAAHVVYQVVAHLHLFLHAYLPASDAAPGGGAGEASLRGFLGSFDELARYALASEPGVLRELDGAPADPRGAYASAIRAQDLERRAELEELLRRAHAWLSVAPADRRVVRTLMAQMRTPQGVGELLLGPQDRARLGAFLDAFAREDRLHRDPDEATSWSDPGTGVAYRVRILDPPAGCAFLSITTDLTGVVPADLGDMTHEVKARFCQQPDGQWRYGRS